jgi:hypothetical protein
LWYLFASFEGAEKCVLENQGDLFEYSFNYALIEEIPVLDKGTTNPYEPRKEWWYRFEGYTTLHNEDPDITHEDEKAIVIPCEKPQCLNRIVMFWVG